MSEYLTKKAVECELHQFRLFSLDKSMRDLSQLVHRWQPSDCSESSIVPSDVYFLVQNSPILFQWSVAVCSIARLLRPLLLNLSFLEVTS